MQGLRQVGVRAMLLVGLAGILSGCQSIQNYHDGIDQRVIERQRHHTRPLIERFVERATRLPANEALIGPTSEPLIRSVPGSKELRLTPSYQQDLVALDERAKSQLARLAEQLDERDDVHIEVIGHASSVPLGAASRARFGDNAGLAKARAEAVADALHVLLPNATITTDERGSSEPVSAGTSLHNRRVEVRARYSGREEVARPGPEVGEIPASFAPWWQDRATASMGSGQGRAVLEESVDELFVRTIKHSSQVRVFNDIPIIRETAIQEAEGDFDLRAFAEAQYSNTNEPVGSTLTTGGSGRFSQRDTRLRGGLRQKVATGGEVELSQRVGTLDNNSVFFIPDEQGSSRLAVRFSQPLLNGAGVEYNRASVAIAKLDSRIALDEFKRQFETHLLEVARSYWSLYRERTLLLQRQRLVSRGESLVAELEARRGLDTLDSQARRAQAELAARRAASVRAELAVRNAQSRIAALVNDPAYFESPDLEVVTRTAPTHVGHPTDMRRAVQLAIANRPEIKQAIKQVHAGAIRAEMSKRELLPVLNLILESRVDGLDDEYHVGGALHRQFNDGRPSVAVGLQFEMPLQNRRAKARRQRRMVELRQLTDQLETSLETILLEVKVAVREVHTAHRELTAQYHAMQAAQRELETLESRRDVDSGDGRWASGHLNELIDSQRRLGSAEQDYVNAVAVYNVALLNLDRATGQLLETQGIDPTPRRRAELAAN